MAKRPSLEELALDGKSKSFNYPSNLPYVKMAFGGGAVFMPLSLAAEIIFSQTATTTLTDKQAIGTAVKQEGPNTFIYVAADGSVQKYDTLFNPISSNIINFVGTPNFMNSGLGNTITFSTPSIGLRDIDATTAFPTGISYGPSSATSISKQFTDASGDVYVATFDSGNFNLYNKTTNTSSLIASGSSLGISGNGLIDFIGYNGANNVANATFVVAASNGYVAEYNMTTGLTGSDGNISLISGGSLTGLSYFGNKLAYSSYDPLAGDYGASQLNYGDVSGFAAVPEPAATALALGIAGLAAVPKARRAVVNFGRELKEIAMPQYVVDSVKTKALGLWDSLNVDDDHIMSIADFESQHYKVVPIKP